MAPEDQVAAEVNKDPFTSRLKPIVSDNKTKGGMPAWVTKSYNMDTDMIDPKTGLATINHGTVVVKSIWWKGFYAFYSSGRTQYIYCGDGQKTEEYNTTFYPTTLPVMMQETDEIKPFSGN